MLLDHFQELVVEAPVDKNIRVTGAPGSGKTRTLTMRYSRLVIRGGLKPSRILVLTFSKKAADEMGKRIARRLDLSNQAKNQISTINAFCYRLYNDWRVSNKLSPLKVWRYGNKDAMNPQFMAAELMNKHCGIADLSMFDAINKTLKSNPEPSPDLLKDIDMSVPFAKKAFEAWKQYEIWMKEHNLTDFYGQVWNVDRLMHKNPIFARMVGQRFDKIMADECQDMFPQSYRILLKLAEESSIELYGDPSQSIYGFNGAAPHLFYEIEIKNLESYYLSNNYRSQANIVKTVNDFGPETNDCFEKMICKTDKPGDVKIHMAEDMTAQADYIAEEIKRKSLKYSDVFVLARTNGQCSALYQRLLQLGIPSNYSGNFSIWDKTHIKAGIGYLAVVKGQDGPDDLGSIINIPSDDYKHVFGAYTGKYSPTRFLPRAAFLSTTFKDILNGNFKATKAQRPGISNILKFVERLKGLDDRQKVTSISGAILKWAQFSGRDQSQVESDLAMLWDKLDNLDYNIDGLRNYIEKVNDARRKIKADDNKVQVMTIHQVKGLEALYVFVTGLSEPFEAKHHAKSGFHPGRNVNPEINEENCLYYVSISRAIERLYLTYYEKSGEIAYDLSSFVTPHTKKIAGYYNEK